LTLCDGNIVISISGTEVSLVSNNYPSSYFIKIKIRTPSWQWVVTLCTSQECIPGVSLTIPQAIIDQYGDTYVVDIQGACLGSFDFVIDENTGGGIDNDNDGICSDVDCDDNNPNLPVTQDTPCDDNNPNTINDLILSGECVCAGTPIGGMTKIAAIGDFGDFTENGSEFELAGANLVDSWNPEAVITLRDNNYELGEASNIDPNIGQFYQQYIYPYNGAYGSGSRTNTNRFWPSLGNHDWATGNADAYIDYFELLGNERYYDFVIGDAHFFVIDSDPHEPDGRYHPSEIQPLWLQAELANSTETWNIVYFHHPPYTSSAIHANESVMQWPFTEW